MSPVLASPARRTRPLPRLARALRAALGAACLALASPALGVAPALARPFVDAAGRTVEVPDRIVRAVPAGPPAALLLYTLAPARMAAWVRAPTPEERPYLLPATWDLPATGRLTGRGGTANVEAVLALKPDLIVDVGATGSTYASLADRVQAQTGIPYILLDGSFAKTAETYRTLGALLGEADAAEALAAYAERTLAEVGARVATVPEAERPRVYYARGPRGLETAFAGSINTEILAIVGARNVAAGGNGLSNVSPEQVLAWNPDAIVTLDPGFRPSAADPLWGSVKAVRDGRILRAPVLPFAWFDAPPGVNRLVGLPWLAGQLHPALFPEPLPEIVRGFYRLFYHVDLDAAQVERLLSGAAAPLR